MSSDDDDGADYPWSDDDDVHVQCLAASTPIGSAAVDDAEFSPDLDDPLANDGQ